MGRIKDRMQDVPYSSKVNVVVDIMLIDIFEIIGDDLTKEVSDKIIAIGAGAKDSLLEDAKDMVIRDLKRKYSWLK